MYCVYGNSGWYIHGGPLFGGGPLLGGSVIESNKECDVFLCELYDVVDCVVYCKTSSANCHICSN